MNHSISFWKNANILSANEKNERNILFLFLFSIKSFLFFPAHPLLQNVTTSSDPVELWPIYKVSAILILTSLLQNQNQN